MPVGTVARPQQIEGHEELVRERIPSAVHERQPLAGEHLAFANERVEAHLVRGHPSSEHTTPLVTRLGGQASFATPRLEPPVGVLDDRDARPVELLLHEHRLASARA